MTIEYSYVTLGGLGNNKIGGNIITRIRGALANKIITYLSRNKQIFPVLFSWEANYPLVEGLTSRTLLWCCLALAGFLGPVTG